MRDHRSPTGPSRPRSITGGTALVVITIVVASACTTGTSVGSAASAGSTSGPSTTAVSPGSSPTSSASGSTSTVADGEAWVVYQWLDDNGDGIYLIRPDGTGQHQIVPDLTGSERHPDWAPDGQRIAFIRNTPADRSELWVVDADGESATNIAKCDLPCNEWNYPDWSADGASIYVDTTSHADGGPPSTFGLDRFDVSSGTRTTVREREDGMTAEQHRLSPDETTVAFTRGDIEDLGLGMAIVAADLKGGPERPLTDPMLYGAHPDWTADGRIIFNTRDLGLFQETTEVANLYIMDADGLHLTQLTDRASLDRLTQPRVTPDGSGITYTRATGPGWGDRTLAIIGTDGSGDRWLTDPPVNGTHAQLRPLP